MKKSLLSLIAIALCFCVDAQQTTYRQLYDIALFDMPAAVTQSTTGNYLISGTNISFGAVGNLTETNTSGTVVWSKSYTAGGFFTQFNDVKKVSTGGYIVTGSTGDGCLIMKIDASGNVTWSNRYRVASSNSDEYGNRVIETSDGGFVVAGSVSGVDPDGAGALARQDSSKMFAMKVNSAGTLQWMRTFFYTTAFDDDDYLRDVAETSDGYVFVGGATIVAGDGQSDATVLKTDVNGNLQWARRWGNSNSEEAYAIITTGTNTVLISGDDNGRAFLLNLSTPNSGPGTTGTNSLYTTSGFTALGSSLVRTVDGHNTIFGTRFGITFTPPFLDYSSYILKTNVSTGAVMFSKAYNSGFISILPVGIQTSDNGYLMNSLSFSPNSSTSYDYEAVKTDSIGGQTGASCAPTSPTFVRSSYSPTLTSFSSNVVTTGLSNSVSVVAANITPAKIVNCLNIACTAPPTPSVSANPSGSVCPGTPVTISASGGSNVTYRVYTLPSGGTSIGTAPLVVTPAATTTYYVEADDNSNPGCVSARASITITVTQPPSSVGTISGSANPCLGSATYTITATGATTYTWSVSGGGSITGGQNTAAATINWTTSGGPYTVSVAVANTCGTVNRTLTVNVVAGVSGVGAIANPNPVCVGSTVTLIGAGSGVNNWSWTGPNGFTSSTQSPQILNVTAAAAGTYNLTASSTCGSGTASVLLAVNDKPQTVSATINPNTICAGNTLNLTGAGTGATSWSWSGPNSFTAATQNASVSNAQQNATGTYTLTATNACGNTTATANATVNTVPTQVNAAANPNPVCAGTVLNLTGGATGATSYSWTGPNSFTASTQNATVSNFQSINVGTYTLTATNTCGSTTASEAVTLATVPTNVTAGANLTDICSNANLILSGNANGANSFSWTGPNGFTSNLQNPTRPNVTTADSGTYTLTATNACGNATATVLVDVDNAIQNLTSNASPNDTVCAGANINLSSTGSQVDTWAWTGPNSFTSALQNPTITNSTAANSGTYTLTATNACGSQTSSVVILVNNPIQNLSASASSNGVICSGSSITLSATGTNVNSWNWTGPNSFNTTQQNPNINPATTINSGTYTVTAFNACGNQSATATVQVDTFIQNVSASASPDDTVCAGGTINLSASGTNVTSWSWTGPSSFTSALQTVSISNVTTANSGTYNVIATNACGNSNASVSVLVNNSIQNLTASASSNGVICSGSSITLSASAADVNNWNWTGPNGFSSTQQNPSINPAATINAGTYTVTANNACGNQTATVAVQIDTLIENLTASASPNDTVCAGGTINLSATGTNVTSWSWTGPSNFTSPLQTVAISNVTTAQSGTYNLIASNACGNSTASINVLVNNSIQNLTATASSNGLICTGSSITLSASGTDVNNWNWTGPNGFTSAQQNPVINPASTNNNGTYTVTANNACGNQTATVTVQVDTLILNLSAAASPNDTICAGATINLSANGTNVTSWNWTGPNAFSSLQQNPTISNAQAISSGTYTLTASNACGNSNASVTVLVKTVPVSPASITGPLTPCGNTNAVYSVTANPDVTSYTWAVSGGGVITNGQGTNSIGVTWGNTAGAFNVSVTAANECGGSTAAVVTVNVDVPTILGINTSLDTVCFGSFSTLTATATPAGTVVNWYATPTSQTPLATGLEYATDFLNTTTTFYAEAISPNGTCTNAQGRVPVTITVTPLPVVTLTSDHENNIIFENEVLIITALPDTFDRYDFYVNGLPVQSDVINTYASSSYHDKDSVWVIVTEGACTSLRADTIVRVVDFPNAFTPNTDGRNDVFLKNYDLVILNRWGQELYRGVDGWDGRYKGDKVSPGTYFYVVQLADITDRKTTIKGTVLLIED